jgi:hypothetical protein
VRWVCVRDLDGVIDCALDGLRQWWKNGHASGSLEGSALESPLLRPEGGKRRGGSSLSGCRKALAEDGRAESGCHGCETVD